MARLVALTREVSPAIADCELTHLSRIPIDLARARAQHAAYEDALRQLGCDVRRVSAGPSMPDSVFIEDTAFIVNGLGIIARPGAESRREEPAAVEAALAPLCPLARIAAPGTLDGGDVLVTGRTVFIGVTSRTSEHAINQVRVLVTPLGCTVVPVRVTGCLHLKSAVTEAGDGILLANRAWLPDAVFAGFKLVDVDPDETHAANIVRVGDRLIYPTAFPRTLARLRARGFDVTTVDVSELAKAEGAVTCCSLILEVA